MRAKSLHTGHHARAHLYPRKAFSHEHPRHVSNTGQKTDAHHRPHCPHHRRLIQANRTRTSPLHHPHVSRKRWAMPSCFKTRKLSTFCSISSGSRERSRGRDLLRQTEGLGLPAPNSSASISPSSSKRCRFRSASASRVRAHLRGSAGRVCGLRRPRVGHLAAWESSLDSNPELWTVPLAGRPAAVRGPSRSSRLEQKACSLFFAGGLQWRPRARHLPGSRVSQTSTSLTIVHRYAVIRKPLWPRS